MLRILVPIGEVSLVPKTANGIGVVSDLGIWVLVASRSNSFRNTYAQSSRRNETKQDETPLMPTPYTYYLRLYQLLGYMAM